MELIWTYKHFTELTTDELYAALHLRNMVFVTEQNCAYTDTDYKDQLSRHLMGWYDGTLVAYCRILPPGVSYPGPGIGRVITHPGWRGKNIGKLLMKMAVEKCNEDFRKYTITIGAQLYLKNFYESLGFIQVSEVYDEDGIDHIQMKRP